MAFLKFKTFNTKTLTKNSIDELKYISCSIIPLNKITFLSQTTNKSIEEYKIYLEFLIKTVIINITIDNNISISIIKKLLGYLLMSKFIDSDLNTSKMNLYKGYAGEKLYAILMFKNPITTNNAKIIIIYFFFILY